MTSRRSWLRREVTLVAGLIGLSMLAACGSSSTSYEVRGTVTAGPACPVQQAGVACPDTPVRGTVVARSSDKVVARAVTDASGNYVLTVRPGTYTIGVEIEGVLPRCPEQSVTVTDRAMRLDVSCDSGVR